MEITTIDELQKHGRVDFIFRSSHLVVKGVKFVSVYDDPYGVCAIFDGYVPCFSFDTYFNDILKKVIIVPYGEGLTYKRSLFGYGD